MKKNDLDEDGAEGLPESRLLTRQERWRKRNPEKARAHQRVKQALRAGRLVKQPCKVCGAPAEGHHPDYSKPLLLVWLCRRHHREAHRRKIVKGPRRK